MINLLHYTLFALLWLTSISLISCLGAGTANSSASDHETDTISADTAEIIAVEQPMSPPAYTFIISEITDSVLNIIDGVSYNSSSPVKISDLRYIKVLHYTDSTNVSMGELICNKSIAQDLAEIFGELYRARYPIERMRLIDYYDGNDEASMADNNTSCYNCRPITGGKKMSKHAWGLAIDINPLYNPYIKRSGEEIIKAAPKGSEAYAERTGGIYQIIKGDICWQQFRAHGFNWGGDWRHSVKDYQHFQKGY